MIKNGRKDSTWQGFDENGQKIYEEEYANGKFIKGQRLDVEGQQLTYDKLWEPPVYPGGENVLMKFLRKNLKYPRSAQERGAHGIVVVKFTVNEDGSVNGTAVHAGVERSLNEEALRVAKLLPAWIPGKVRGRVKAVPFRLPISFSLR